MPERSALQYVAFIPIAIVVIMAYVIYNLPRAKTLRAQERAADPLVKEYIQIGLPFDTHQFGECTYDTKGLLVRLYECRFQTTAGLSDILAFYTRELSKGGWKLLSTSERFTYWCRHADRMAMQYDLVRSKPWAYSLGISRGVPPECGD